MPEDVPGTNPLSAEHSTADLYRMQVREMRDYAMFTLNPDGYLTSWNAGVQKHFGYSEEEWIGRHGSMIFTPADKAREVCEAEMRKARENGSATDIRWHRRKDGSEFFANGFMNALRDDRGALVGYAKVMGDETERKQLQDSLTESNAALEQFAYVASHDMQEPLRTMRSYAQLLSLRYGGKLDADADQFLAFIVGASARMTALVRDLLAYARLTTEDDPPRSVALDEDLETALTNLDQAIEESHATITHDAMPVLRADRGQMVRLFQNLIGNAIKYRKPNQPPKIHVTAEHRGSEWVFTISDNGIGFDPKYSSSIFAPFKRLHTVEEYPGTGVGLAICRRIVQAHGGRIWAESQPGVGTKFFFTLPSDKQADRETAPRAESSRLS
jgi:PAS domain S-box-containing protein